MINRLLFLIRKLFSGKDKATPKKLGRILLEILKSKTKVMYDKTANDLMNVTGRKISVDINQIKNELACLDIYIIHRVVYDRFGPLYEEIIRSFRNELSKYLEEESSKEISMMNMAYVLEAVLYYMKEHNKLMKDPQFLGKFSMSIARRILGEEGMDIRYSVFFLYLFSGGLKALADLIDSSIKLIPEKS